MPKIKSHVKKSEFMCPFCIRPFAKKEIHHQCGKCGEMVTPKRFEKPPFKCACGGVAKTRLCPMCREAIPSAALETKYFPFSIVGITGSGKTNYITVMLEELPMRELRLAVVPINNDAKHLQTEHKKQIYTDHETPAPTTAGMTPKPQIWKILHNDRAESRLNKLLKRTPTYTFTIFDGAGEHSQDVSDQNIINYIMYSEAVIVTIDPLTIPEVRKKINSRVVASSERDDSTGTRKSADEALNHIVELIKSTRKGGSTESKLDIPVAIVLTKFDTIISNPNFSKILGTNIKNARLEIRDKKISVDEIDDISEQIRYFLDHDEVGAHNFVGLVDGSFTNYRFFGVSSYGTTPESSGTVSEVNPHRVLDPILWLFHQKEFID